MKIHGKGWFNIEMTTKNATRMSSKRSCLIIPRDNWTDAMFTSGAGALVFDFADEEGMERHAPLLRRAREARGPSRLLVRLPGLDDPSFDLALERLRATAPDGVVLQATEGGARVQQLGSRLAVFEAEADVADGATRIVAELSTPAGFLTCATLARSSPRLEALLFGRAALASALDADEASAPIESARALLVLSAAAARVRAFDAPCGDPGKLEEECLAARRDGFFGKCAASEVDIRVIERVFEASRAEKSPHSPR
jgi:citrate lyase subunit beta/citryl-CoA lyase